MSESKEKPLLKWSVLSSTAQGRHLRGAALVQVGNRIFCIGHNGSVRTVSVLHLNTWEWEDLQWNRYTFISPRATLVDDKICIIAPDRERRSLSMVVEFDLVLHTFTKRSVNDVRHMKASPVFAEWRREIIMFGGHREANLRGAYNGPDYDVGSTRALDVDTMKFRTLYCKGAVPKPRDDAATALVGRRMYLFGGNKTSRRFFNDLWIADLRLPGLLTWSSPQLHGVFPSPAVRATLNEIDGKLILFGGSSRRRVPNQQLWMYCPRKREWKNPLERTLLVEGDCPSSSFDCGGLRTDGAILYISVHGLYKLELSYTIPSRFGLGLSRMGEVFMEMSEYLGR